MESTPVLASSFSVGLGYRRPLHDPLLAIPPEKIDFVEIAPENYAGIGGRWKRRLDAVRARWPVITHGLALSLGGNDPIDADLVEAAAAFAELVRTPWHSDHLSWSSAGGHHLHDLLPVPFSRDSARRIALRMKSVARSMPVPLVVENVSAYARRPEDSLDEPEFLSEVIELSDCRLLLDVNNVYVNAVNFGGDPHDMIRRMPLRAAVQMHVAGFHREDERLLIDTHGEAVASPVWRLLEEALERTGPLPVLLERDHNFPAIEELLEEIEVIRSIGARVFSGARGSLLGERD